MPIRENRPRAGLEQVVDPGVALANPFFIVVVGVQLFVE
jgi:hypothetical protein